MNSQANRFSIPNGVVEVEDEYQIKLAHYELLHLKPRGTMVIAGETREVTFQFFAQTEKTNEKLAENPVIYARLDEAMSPNVTRILQYIDAHPRTEAMITISLLQFKIIFFASRLDRIHEAKQRTYRMVFPNKFLKTHRRKFIRIPFNENFPISLSFQTDAGVQTRKLRDLSREGMRMILEPSDSKMLSQGARLKQTVLKVLNREISLGVRVVSLYPNQFAGLTIIAISEDDRTWLKSLIRILIKQILNLPNASSEFIGDEETQK